jgi:exodeoxyribonuclease VII large subunit
MLKPDPSAPQLDFSFDEPRHTRRIWPVRELVGQVRELIEQEFSDVWVEGEISNFRPAPSGHVYFTLKDADAQLPIVLFRRQALLLRFRPEDGLHVIVRGRVSVYEQRGQMQLVAETVEPVGAGSLQLAFEQLKERLKAEGLFDAVRKQLLPAFPRTVGIVTSPTGAVIRDFLNIVARRHSGLNVLLVPVSVQGDQAPAEIESALAHLNASGLVDIIVLARGGGSLEDLAAFAHLPRRPPPSLLRKPSTRSRSTSPTTRTVSIAPSAFSSCMPTRASAACPSAARRLAS